MPATTIEDIQATKNFSTQSHILANDFHLSSKDAEAMLLERVYHRLQSGKEFNDWIVTFSRKDCERTLGNEYRYKANHIDDGYQMDNIPNATNEGYQEVTPEQLTKIFPDSRSREFVRSILNVGKEETMNAFDLTRQQFNSRLNHKVKYLHDHSELINRVLDTDERKEMIMERQVVQELLDFINTSTLSDEAINSIIRQAFDKYSFLHDYLDECTKRYHLKYQGRVVQDFMQSGIDSDKFLEYLYQRLDYLSNQLKGSTIND